MIDYHHRFQFGSKAQTLTRLQPLLTKSSVPQLLNFTVDQWKNGSRAGALQQIRKTFGRDSVIIRSSASTEDAGAASQAGAFLSVPNIPALDRDRVEAVVDNVIASYAKCGASDSPDCDEQNRVIVQRMVADPLISGVVFTQDLNTGAPYYVINYDDKSGSTHSVTSGIGGHNRTLYVFRDAYDQLSSPRFRKILEAVREIEVLAKNTCLDIEFALTRDFRVQVFQVRQITTQPNWNRGLALVIRDTVDRLREGLVERYGAAGAESESEDLGDTVLGNMPDWNPAEMIGTTPRPLAFSLYRRLITDRPWRIARRRMGYRETPGMPLMVSLAGQPYIDVRQSFYSFLPADLPAVIGDKLVRAWLKRLRENHHLHDKVEFDVAITALSPDFDERVRKQIPGVLDPDELARFKESHRAMTNDLLTGRVASIDEQLALIDTLKRRRTAIIHDGTRPNFETISALLEDVIEYGTIPFSILARHAFIAKSFLHGLIAVGALSQEEASDLESSISTVATRFIDDIRRYVDGTLSRDAFLETYGHLRPGTYDILSLRYDRRLSALKEISTLSNRRDHVRPFELCAQRAQTIDRLLASLGVTVTAAEVLTYIRRAIEGREYAKFVFTRNISEALELIAAWGECYGLSREELSFIDIRDLFDCVIEPTGRSIETELRELSERGRCRHALTSSIRLPFLITRLSDLTIVPLAVEHPNYITRKHVRAPVVEISGADLEASMVDNRIVAIESADPGFDWIFARPLCGLVTRFGGANSHMAIRCAEFGLPAAIGCGEQIYEAVVRSGLVDLNCAEGRITTL